MEDKMFELMTQMYAEMKEGFSKVDSRLDAVEKRLDTVEKGLDTVEKRLGTVESDVQSLKNLTFKIENDHGKKLEALLDGYKQNAEQLDRIEKEVARHEEVIIRKVK